MENAYFIIGGSLVFVFLLWVAVGVRHLKVSVSKVRGAWSEILLLMGSRYDLLPILVEVLGRHDSGSGQFKDFRRIGISSRDNARRIKVASEEKVESEGVFHKALGDLIWFGNENDEADRDILFLEIKKEVEDLSRQIEVRLDKYNGLVSKYNLSVGFWLLRPISLVMRLKKAIKFKQGK